MPICIHVKVFQTNEIALQSKVFGINVYDQVIAINDDDVVDGVNFHHVVIPSRMVGIFVRPSNLDRVSSMLLMTPLDQVVFHLASHIHINQGT